MCYISPSDYHMMDDKDVAFVKTNILKEKENVKGHFDFW